ncbi:MAG: esterase-like activity of phytase family protein [Prevotella sp.]|nr:esterase-like activity of phytase family protein [Prevotella sp.]
MKKWIMMAALLPMTATAQDTEKGELKATLNEQACYPATIAAGNYSGITWLGDNRYAVVSDKSKTEGFFIFHINIDPDTGGISHAYSNEFRSSEYANRDMEGVAFFPKDTTVWISGESDNRIMEHRLDNGKRTGRELNIPDSLRKSHGNLGFESLTYNAARHHFWTVSESTLPIDGKPSSLADKHQNVLRLLCFDDSLEMIGMYAYLMDMPEATASSSGGYCHGVSDLCALDDGRLLVMERELYVPHLRIGAWVHNKIYIVDPTVKMTSPFIGKKLLTSFKTKFTGLKNNFANFEGMCLGPKLNDGRQTLILICDSQDQFKGLKDWLMTIVIE